MTNYDITIGTIAIYNGTDHRYLTGNKVIVRGVFRPDPNGDEENDLYINDPEFLERVGGVQDGDVIDVAPWIERRKGFSFVTSDVDPADLEVIE